jgi:hypothetical protein
MSESKAMLVGHRQDYEGMARHPGADLARTHAIPVEYAANLEALAALERLSGRITLMRELRDELAFRIRHSPTAGSDEFDSGSIGERSPEDPAGNELRDIERRFTARIGAELKRRDAVALDLRNQGLWR